MDSIIKPIQPTPEICGEDAKRILQEVFTMPSQEAIEEKRKKLERIKGVIKK